MAALNQTALHSLHQQRGGRMVDFAGWSMPVQYTSILEEHQVTRSGVGLFDVSHMGRLMFPAEGGAYLETLLTRSVAKLASGRVRYSLIANDQGQILDDVLAYHVPATSDLADHWMLVVNAGNRDTILAHLRDHPGPEPCAWEDATGDTSMIAVQGPQALECVGPLLSSDIRKLKYYRCERMEVCGFAGWVSRTGYTGEDGCEIIVPNEAAVKVWESLEQQPAGGRPVGLGARDTLRLEAGMPLYGHELSREITPFQAGLGFAVNLKQREFVGSDALARQAEHPPSTVRVGLRLGGKRIARENCPVLADGEPVGVVTSGSYSPTLECPIAMALAPAEHAALGAALEIDIRGRTEPATVVEAPFYKRSSKP